MQKLRKHILEILPVMIIGIALLVYILSAAFSYGRLDEKIGRLSSGWTLSGELMEVLPTREIRGAGETTAMSVRLGSDFKRPQTLCFYTVYADVRVMLNGEPIYSFTKPDGDRTAKAAPSIWNEVHLEGECDGALLEIHLSTPYENFANMIPAVRYGDADSITRFVSMNTMPHFVVALAILFVGLVFAIVSMTLRFYVRGNTGMYSLSLFIVVLALFLAARQNTILLKLYENASYITIEHVAFLLCPVMYTRYLMRSSAGVQKRISRVLHAVSIANAAVVLFLQLMNWRDLAQMSGSTRYLCIVVALYVFILELRGRGRVWYCLATLAAIGVFLYYYITENISWLAYAGIFAYLYVIVYRVIAAIVRSEAEEIRLEAALKVSKSEIATIQITSHFFYHTLDSIRALIRMDADKAYKMTGDFAKYVRYRVDGVERLEEKVSFARELRSIRAYTDIKQAQLGSRFTMIFDVETEDFEILPLTVQPLVENAVIHAVQKRREGGVVRLLCRETEKEYAIQVIDNGPGSADEEVHTEQKQSVAISNVNTRLNYYGIAPLKFEKNASGGMTVSLNYPKKIAPKGKT